MREIPFVANEHEVREILRSGRIQFRRVFRPQPELITAGGAWLYDGEIFVGDDAMQSHLFHDVYGNGKSPYGAVYGDGTSDRLWVREAFMEYHKEGGDGYWYRADCDAFNLALLTEMGQWVRSSHMPRRASRIMLGVTDVCIELVDDDWVWVIDATRV